MTNQGNESVFGANHSYVKRLLHQNRRRWLLRKWRSCWNEDRDVRKQVRYSEYLRALFGFENRYRVIKLLVRHDQNKGRI